MCIRVSILPLFLRFVEYIFDLFYSVLFFLYLIRFTLFSDIVRVTFGVDYYFKPFIFQRSTNWRRKIQNWNRKRCVLSVELTTLNMSFNPVATWHVKCVPNLPFAYVMHTLLVSMFAYYHEKFLTLIYFSKQFCGMIMENVWKHSFAYSYKHSKSVGV